MTKRLVLRESHPPYTLSIEEEDIFAQEPIILERDGQPVAAIVSLAEYEAFRAWQEVHLGRHEPGLEKDRAAFLEMKDELLKTHPGQFVAIKDGHLVDADPDEYELVKRVYERLGYGPIYVKKVEVQEPIYHISGPRKVR
jgi:hypothetical protein